MSTSIAFTAYPVADMGRARRFYEDVDEFVARLKQQSVKFVLDTLSTPVCRMAVIEDPDGNHLIIHKRHEGARSTRHPPP